MYVFMINIIYIYKYYIKEDVFPQV